MSFSDIAVSVRGLSKSYTIAHNATKHTTAAEALVSKLRNPFQKSEKETFWALKDVEFDIKKGDVVGIIGRNGAGKSTLLKVLSRITEPTSGRIALYGRVGSLLEVGTGFHPELTGRENIYLNGAILGMSKREIARQFDAIVDFSSTEQFLDTPVKRYSSGMYVRLAFAVAAHLSSEILIIDEVLAVGDAEFQRKCLGKMQDVAHSGRTVLFVSHSMGSVASMCNRCILLSKGNMQMIGPTAEVVSVYQNQYLTASETSDLRESHRKGTGDALLEQIVIKAYSRTGEELSVACSGCDLLIELTVRAYANIAESSVGVIIDDANSCRLVDLNSAFEGTFLRMEKGETAKLTFHAKNLLLKPGMYTLELWLGRSGIEMTDWIDQATTLNVADDPTGTETIRVYHAPYLCDFTVQSIKTSGILTLNNF